MKLGILRELEKIDLVFAVGLNDYHINEEKLIGIAKTYAIWFIKTKPKRWEDSLVVKLNNYTRKDFIDFFIDQEGIKNGGLTLEKSEILLVYHKENSNDIKLHILVEDKNGRIYSITSEAYIQNMYEIEAKEDS